MLAWVGPRSHSLAHISAPRVLVLFSGGTQCLANGGKRAHPRLWDIEHHSGALVEMSIFPAMSEGIINGAGAIVFK